MLHVAYALWVIGTPIKFNRPLLLFRLWDTLLRSHPDVDNKGFPEFYYEAVTGSIGPDRLARAYARDFRLVHQSQAVAQSTLRVIFSLRPARTPVFPMETRLEREVVFRSIAACRTLLCTPNEPDLPAFRSHFEMEASYLLLSRLRNRCNYLLTTRRGAQMSRPLPELQSHQVLLLVNKFLIIAMEHNDVGYVCMFTPFARLSNPFRLTIIYSVLRQAHRPLPAVIRRRQARSSRRRASTPLAADRRPVPQRRAMAEDDGRPPCTHVHSQSDMEAARGQLDGLEAAARRRAVLGGAARRRLRSAPGVPAARAMRLERLHV